MKVKTVIKLLLVLIMVGCPMVLTANASASNFDASEMISVENLPENPDEEPPE